MQWFSKRKRPSKTDKLELEIRKLKTELEYLRHENEILASLCSRARLWAKAEHEAYIERSK